MNDMVLQVRLPPAAQDLMERLLCDVDDRLGSHGTDQLKVKGHTTASSLLEPSPALDACKITGHDSLNMYGMTDFQQNLASLPSKLCVC